MSASQTIQLLQPVIVKVVMTPAFRARLISEVQASLLQIEANLGRLEAIREAGAEVQRVEGEIARLRQAREELNWRIREAESLQDGAEIFYQNATSCVNLSVGDDYADGNREVLLKDGKVVEIRNGSGGSY